MEFDQTQVIYDSGENEEGQGDRDKKEVANLKVFSQHGFKETIFPVFQGENVIGRDDKCDIYIPIMSISKKHACIDVQRGLHLIYDCESTNGTKKEKCILTPTVRYELKHGVVLTMGDVICQYLMGRDMEEISWKLLGNEESTSSIDSSGEEMAGHWQQVNAFEEDDDDTLLCGASEMSSFDGQKESGRNPDVKTEANPVVQPFHLEETTAYCPGNEEEDSQSLSVGLTALPTQDDDMTVASYLETTKAYCLGNEKEDSDSSDSHSLLVGLTALPTQDDDMTVASYLETTKAYCLGNEKEDSDSSDSQSLSVGLTALPTQDDDMTVASYLETMKAYCLGNEKEDSDSSDSQSLLVGLTVLPTQDDDTITTFHLEKTKTYCLGNEEEDSDSSDSQSLLVGLTALPTQDDDMAATLESDNEREEGRGFCFADECPPIQACANGASDDENCYDYDDEGDSNDDGENHEDRHSFSSNLHKLDYDLKVTQRYVVSTGDDYEDDDCGDGDDEDEDDGGGHEDGYCNSEGERGSLGNQVKKRGYELTDFQATKEYSVAGSSNDDDVDNGDDYDERQQEYIGTVEEHSHETFGMMNGKDALQYTTPQGLEETKGCEADEPDENDISVSLGSGSRDRLHARSDKEPSDADVQAHELVRKLVSLILMLMLNCVLCVSGYFSRVAS